MDKSFTASAVGGFSIVFWDVDGPKVAEQEADVRWLREQPPKQTLELTSCGPKGPVG